MHYQAGQPDQYHHRYVYDGENRLRQAWSSRDGRYWQRDAEYFYYLHGPLARVETGHAGLIKGTHYDQRELAEVPLYGAARLGVDKERRFLLDSLNYRRSVWNPLAEAWQTLASLDPTGTQVSAWPVVDTQRVHVLGHRRYEFANHLGNVLAVTSDRKILVDNAHAFQYYEADVYSLTDYYPFGMQMTGRTASLYVDTATGEKSVLMDYGISVTCSTCVKVDAYRYGFNGMEGDPEWKGDGNSYTTEFRMLDVRIGRWLSIDPEAAKLPSQSPYAGIDNSPLWKADPNGDVAPIVIIGGVAIISAGIAGRTHLNFCGRHKL